MEDETVGAGEGEEKKGPQVVTAKAKHAIVGDPSYFPKHSVQVGSVARALCFLSHPIDNVENAHSVQIIIRLRKSVGRTACTFLGARTCTTCARKDVTSHS